MTDIILFTAKPRIRYSTLAVRGRRAAAGLMLALVAMLFAGCSTLEVTPITSPPTHVFINGKFVWHDLLTVDVDAAKTFYAGVFGWTFEDHGRYTVVSNDEAAIAGMVRIEQKPELQGPARWLPSLSVADVDASAAQLSAAGGVIHEGPGDLKGRGRFALVSDPQGAQLILLHAASGDPPDGDEVAMGSWLWNELWSKDPPKSIAFYDSLVGYTVLDAPDLANYWILTKDDRWRAGVRSVLFREVDAKWVQSVRVTDPVAVAERVVSFGGEILIHPGEPPSDGNMALIADPTGALLMVQRWPKISPEDEL